MPGHVLHVDDDASGARVVAKVVDHVGEVQIGHGTDADKMRKADLFAGCQVQNGAADGPALGEQREASRFGGVGRKTGVQAIDGGENPHAVGPKVAYSAALRLGSDFLFYARPFFSHLFSTGRNDDGPLHPGLAAFLHDCRHLPDGDGDNGQIDGGAHCRDGRVGFKAQDLLVLWIDGVDRPGKAVFF